MRDLKSNDRRRRLNVIKAVQDRTAIDRPMIPSALATTSDGEAERIDFEALRQRLFAECQGNPSTTLRVEHPDRAPISVVMDRPFLLIGRDVGCDLQLDHEEIKPRHCYVQWIDGQLFCCDITQRTSLFPERQAPSNGQWVDQSISIGPYRLSLADQNVSQPIDYSPLDRSPQLAIEYPHLGLQFDGVEQANNLWPVNRMLTMIGRGSQCKLRLNHKSIAHVQACLLRTPTACWLIDLVNDGTTGVNGRAIHISPVDIGDTLQLGAFQVDVVTTEFRPIAPMPVAEIIDREAMAKALPPIRFDRQPADYPRKSVDVPVRSETDDHPNSILAAIDDIQADMKSITPPEIDVSDIPWPLVRTQCSDRTTASAQTNVADVDVEISDEPGVTSEQEAASTSQQPDVTVSDLSIAQFIQHQQSQLATLKWRLKELKQIYDTAAGQLISKRMRDTLEKPVIETLKCHDAMQESLDQFLKSLESRPE